MPSGSLISAVGCLLLTAACQSKHPEPATVVLPTDATVGDLVSLWVDSSSDPQTRGLLWESEAEHIAHKTLGLSQPLTLQLTQVEDVTHTLLLWAGLVVAARPAGRTVYLVDLAHADQAVSMDPHQLLAGGLPDAGYVATTYTCPPGEAAYESILDLATAIGVKCSGGEELVLTGPARRVIELVRTLQAI